MTTNDSPAALLIHPSGELAILVWRSTGDPTADAVAWDQAVTDAYSRGFTDMHDEPDAQAGGAELYVILPA